jgi:hypothetical protein
VRLSGGGVRYEVVGTEFVEGEMIVWGVELKDKGRGNFWRPVQERNCRLFVFVNKQEAQEKLKLFEILQKSDFKNVNRRFRVVKYEL